MDSGNRSVLQFVSAAAQALETHDIDDLSGDDDFRHELHKTSTSTAAGNAIDNQRTQQTADRKLDLIKEMLAEATGNCMDDTSREITDNLSLSPATPVVKERSTAEKIQIVFDLPSVEDIRAEWKCCIVRSAIVPGILYVTERHICFYASLPQNQNYRKAGYLLITGKLANQFERCYCELKNDVLAWYESASDKYSPKGKVDLKNALAVKQSKKRQHGFKLITMDKTWHFQADTKAAMVEWMNVFHKAIFRAKNTGNNLKISLPFENIIDIEQTEAVEFQQFLQIRAVGIDDSFVVDEYYFAYFDDTRRTFECLRNVWDSYQSDTRESHDKPYYSTSDTSSDISPSISISDLPDTESQPIVVPSLGGRPSASIASGSSGMNRDTLTPATPEDIDRSQCTYDPDPSSADVHDSSSSENEEQAVVGWLDEKRRSGMRLVYGLLGGNTGSEATIYRSLGDTEHEDDDDDNESLANLQAGIASDLHEKKLFPHEDQIDGRTLANFRKYFVFPESEKLQAVYRCSLMKTLPCYGKLYISSNHVSFNSKGFATRARMIVPFSDILRIQKIRSRGYIFHTLSILLHNKKEIFLEFSTLTKRNSCFARLFLQHKWATEARESPSHVERSMCNWEARVLEEEYAENHNYIMPSVKPGLPVISSSTQEPLVYQAPEKSLHFTCITIGTRGDVQPYIALCKALMEKGHRCRIATHDEFKDWIEAHGIEFRSVGGDPSELMRLCVENSFFSVNFVMEGLRLFKGWIDELLDLTWKACQGTEVIIESPSAMVGIHIAEKLQVPYFRSFPMPMTRTRSFPHPFATPNNPKGRLYNDMTYVLFDHAVWRAIATRTNNFRRDVLGLRPTSYEKLEVWKVPYLYSFSPNIVPSPLDWMDWIHCTGYWFLDNSQTGWQPDEKMQAFLNAKDTRPLVYIGFGSIIVSDPKDMTRIIVEATLLSNVRAIVSKGWSSRLQEKANKSAKQDAADDLLTRYPDTILSVQAVPHDWLFPKLRAVVHHGGAGTTAAGLRAGVPTVIKPFFADQFFWGERVEEMGLGICIKDLTVESLSAALRVVSTDENMLKMAKVIGTKIRQENGVETAIQCIYRDMDLAKARTLSSARRTSAESEDDTDILESSLADEDQEWTLIESTASGSISPSSWRPCTS